MKAEWSRFAPFGLIVSAVAAIAAIVFAIIPGEWSVYIQISLALVVLGLAIFVILDPDRVRKTLSRRQVRYGSNALLLSVAFIGILVVVNYLVYNNSKRWDLTEDQQNTLSPETVDTLSSLEEPVEALAFYTGRLPTDQAQGLLDQYQYESKGQFTYRFIDPEKDPIAAQNANITRDGTIVLVMGDRQEPVEFFSETEMTAALVRMISKEVRAVYFLEGHGERSINRAGEESYTLVKQTLERKNYQVAALNLLVEHAIPEDADVVVIAGPQKPLSAEEVEILNEFLQGGGSVIVLLEPSLVTDFGDLEDPLSDYLQAEWGIRVGEDIVLDPNSQNPFWPAAYQYANHPITQKLQGVGMITFFPTARSVQMEQTEQGENSQQTLIYSSDATWAETDLAGVEAWVNDPQSNQIEGDPAVDSIGPVSLAVVSENGEGKQRLLVYGDSDFTTDAFYNQLGNGDLFINSIDWAAEQEELINLTPKDSIQRMMIPPQEYTLGLILFGSVFLLPGIVFFAGVVVWARKRKRG